MPKKVRTHSPTGNPLTKFVNLWQSKETRREKYNLVRSFGLSPDHAHQMRDWHLTKIALYLKQLGRDTSMGLVLAHPEHPRVAENDMEDRT